MRSRIVNGATYTNVSRPFVGVRRVNVAGVADRSRRMLMDGGERGAARSNE